MAESLIDRIDRFLLKHREYRIGFPYATHSGYWEVSVHGRADAAFDNGRRMMKDLEAREARHLRLAPEEPD